MSAEGDVIILKLKKGKEWRRFGIFDGKMVYLDAEKGREKEVADFNEFRKILIELLHTL